MTTLNDAMFAALRVLHPTVAPTLGDLLHAAQLAPNDLGSFEFYNASVPTATTWSDAAFAYWNDADYAAFNLELEDGNDLLLEGGEFMLLEAGNG